MENKINKFPHDIFKLDYKKLSLMDGWGKQSVENLKYSINEKNISLDRLIYSLESDILVLKMQKFCQNILDLSKFKSLSKDSSYKELLNIDGIGETQVNSIKNFFSNKVNLEVLRKLEKVLNIKNATIIKKDGLLKNKSFLVTGKLDGISRAEIKSMIENNSGISVSSVSKKLNYLIVGEKPTKEKLRLLALKIDCIDQSQFLKMLNKAS